ncbi:MAG: alpha/beta hydrolase [Chloroflexota bacterium]
MFIPHNKAQLYAVEFGNAPRTFVAHGGWTGSWELWTEPFMPLSQTWHTVAYDHRGTGVTSAPVESISMENMVADLFAVLDKLNIEKCVLAAESAGGMVAVNAVLQQPSRFEGLVLVDALLNNENDGSDAGFIHGLKANFQATIGGFVDACVPESEPNSTEIRSWGRKILARATSESAIRLLECTHGLDLRPKLSQIQQRTLILHGDLDVIVPLSDSEYAAAQIPNSHLHVLKGAGHVPTVTRPVEVAQVINQYFS